MLWKRVVFDLETDGLLKKVTKVHCLVLKDIDNDITMSCNDQHRTGLESPISAGLAILKNAEVLYGHNILDFDLRVLKKLYGFETKAEIRDTFIACGLRFNHIKDWDFQNAKFPKHLAGRHSLKAWGYRLGDHKTDYEKWCKDHGIENPWGQWRPEMQEYCEQDVELNTRLVRYLTKQGVPKEAFETETGLKRFLIKMEENGWPFDWEKAIALQGRLAARRHELEEELKELFGSWQVSTGVFVPKKDNKKAGYKKGVPVERFKTVHFNPSSRQHIAHVLKTKYGWEPEEYTDSGQAKVDESTLQGLSYPPVKKLIEYLLVDKRLGQLAEGQQAWLDCATDHPITGMKHIHGRIHQAGTITHRGAHSNPNIGQVPKVGSPYGAECRELFRVPEGWVQIGADASGLEARCLGHFVAKYDGGAYADLLLKGDVHTANRITLELPDGVDEDGEKYRDRTKTWYYAWMFGAGDEKLGKTHSPKASPKSWKSIGKKYKSLFLKATPALAYLIKAVSSKVKSPGYIKSLDGRRVYLRSEHAALNSLIQSAGAVICKRWLYLVSAEMHERYGEPSWEGKWTPLGWIHDEVQLAVRPDIAEEVKALCIKHIESLTEHFKFRCPLTGEAKQGMNWKDTH
jgi:DNA polymerase-1